MCDYCMRFKLTVLLSDSCVANFTDVLFLTKCFSISLPGSGGDVGRGW